MIALNSNQSLTPEEYLEFEKTSELRHEYIDGEIYAMSGASNAHNLINGNLLVALCSQLRGTSCQTYINGMKVRVAGGKRFFYPDILVACSDETDNLGAYYMDQPRLIIEVLSKSTEGFDRGDKFKFYRSISSLQDYILVSSLQYSVDHFRRGDNGLWVLQSHQDLEAKLNLKSLGIEISVADIYNSIEFEKEEISDSE